MFFVTSALLCLCILAEVGATTGATADGSRGSIAVSLLALPRRFGLFGSIHKLSQNRQILNYDHPAEHEGVDLRNYNNVDFRSAIARKEADAAAVIKDMGRDIGVMDSIDTSTDFIETPTNDDIFASVADIPGDEEDASAELLSDHVESPVGAVPVSYGVRIGEDGELDGGEDFGDHVDYESTDTGKDYVEDSDGMEEEDREDEWMAEIAEVEAPGVGEGLQHGDVEPSAGTPVRL